MKNSKYRNKDMLAMHTRSGAGKHGGGKRAKNRRARKTAKHELRSNQ